MKKLLLFSALFVATLAGCKATPPDGGDVEKGTTMMRPAIVISTTKGDMKVVLFPVFMLIGGKAYQETWETQYTEFITGVNTGYFVGATVEPKKLPPLAEYACFTSTSPDTQYVVEAWPRDVQPVRGTLCVLRFDSGNQPGIYADKRKFMVVRKIVRHLPGQDVYPLRGTHFPIGQVIEGFDVLDKLGPTDRIINITMLKDGTPVSAERLQMLGKGQIDNFADVLNETAVPPPAPPRPDGTAPPGEAAP